MLVSPDSKGSPGYKVTPFLKFWEEQPHLVHGRGELCLPFLASPGLICVNTALLPSSADNWLSLQFQWIQGPPLTSADTRHDVRHVCRQEKRHTHKIRIKENQLKNYKEFKLKR